MYLHSAVRRSDWWSHYIQPHLVFGGMFLISLVCFLALLPIPRIDGNLIGSDGFYYYVYTRSLLLDGDVDFTNEYAYFGDAVRDEDPTPTGRPANKYTIGTALLWVPFFALAHLLALGGQAVGLAVSADGYSYFYQSAISIGSITYGTLGFWLAYLCAARLFSRLAALAAVVILWLTSNAIYYLVIEPSMSHMASFFSVALVLTLWFFWLRDGQSIFWWQAVLLGFAGGLVMLVRMQDAIFLLLPYGALLLRFGQALAAQHWSQARHWFIMGLLTAGATVLAFGPQLLAWQAIYGSWSTVPYTSDHDPPFYWFQPNISGVLLSPWRGLFIWHPVYLLALLGLGELLRRERGLALALLGLLALNIYIIAAWWAWWQGDSFGGRMFLNAMWIWVFGFAGLVEWLRMRSRLLVGAAGLALLLVLWNGLSLVQYRLGFIPMGQPLTWSQITIERLALPWLLVERLFGA